MEKQQWINESEKKEVGDHKLINEIINDNNLKNNNNYCSIMFNSINQDFEYNIPYYITKENVNNEILKAKTSTIINSN